MRADFALVTTAGSVSGAVISSVTGSGSQYTVTASTGSGNGTLGLNVVDDDSIVDAAANPLGGAGSGNGSFTTGQSYTIDKTAPRVTIDQAAGQADPTSASPINFTVVFSETVTGFAGGRRQLRRQHRGRHAGGGRLRDRSQLQRCGDGDVGDGTVVASVPAGAASDAGGQRRAPAATSTDNTVTFTAPADTTPPTVSITAPAAGSTVDGHGHGDGRRRRQRRRGRRAVPAGWREPGCGGRCGSVQRELEQHHGGRRIAHAARAGARRGRQRRRRRRRSRSRSPTRSPQGSSPPGASTRPPGRSPTTARATATPPRWSTVSLARRGRPVAG